MPIESLTDRFGRTWKLDGKCYCHGGMKVGANAKDPLNTINAMAPEGHKQEPGEPSLEQQVADLKALVESMRKER